MKVPGTPYDLPVELVDNDPEPFHAEARELARKMFGGSTPFRMGIAMAKLGHPQLSPYKGGTNSNRLFKEGYNMTRK